MAGGARQIAQGTSFFLKQYWPISDDGDGFGAWLCVLGNGNKLLSVTRHIVGSELTRGGMDLEQALRGEVMVYPIIDVPIAASAGRDLAGEHALITLAQQTGGKYYYAESSSLDKTFAQLSEDLRTQYLLGYYPSHRLTDSPFRTISVTLSKPPVAKGPYAIRHRTGYYANPGQ